MYTAGKYIQRCALIVTGKIGKEFIGECWTYSISVLTKLQLKSELLVLPKLQFLGVSRANLREKKHDIFTLQFPLVLKQESRRNWPNRPESYTKTI